MNAMLTIAPVPLPTDPDTLREYRALPEYPKFGVTVAKWRKAPRTPENIAAHFDALMKQLRTLQRQEFKRGIVEPDHCPCPSGTWHTDGKAILKAVNAQNAAALAGALNDEHRKRTDKEVGETYKAMMAVKNGTATPAQQRRADRLVRS